MELTHWRADLHLHTTASDGTDTPGLLVSRAARAGLGAIAVTDHDATLGLPVALRQGSRRGLRVIPGIELSSRAVDGSADVHVLGYFVDPADPDLQRYLHTLSSIRKLRARRMLGRLRERGLEISESDVAAEVGRGRIGRAHIARALVKKGMAESTRDAFARYLGAGACCYVRKPAPAPEEIVSFLRRIGAVPVLAHPGLVSSPLDLDSLEASGLAGVEAHHPEHTPEQVRYWAAVGRRRGLVVTGGSDWHGEGGPHAATIGSVFVDVSAVDELSARKRPRARHVDAPGLAAEG